ncbi:hypothetical protein JCGZ_26592 [Jatropha curcas]|uniref:Uncharacterized protein n=1 Tax=Jatropha curcas TaxID=180498 RepID=A0A067LGN7_JATCU|nr:hypothetical protein JCGZ_26592 [Jatropha curcas]
MTSPGHSSDEDFLESLGISLDTDLTADANTHASMTGIYAQIQAGRADGYLGGQIHFVAAVCFALLVQQERPSTQTECVKLSARGYIYREKTAWRAATSGGKRRRGRRACGSLVQKLFSGVSYLRIIFRDQFCDPRNFPDVSRIILAYFR